MRGVRVRGEGGGERVMRGGRVRGERRGGGKGSKIGINLRCSLKSRHPSLAPTDPEHVRMKSKLVNNGARQTGDNNPVIL